MSGHTRRLASPPLTPAASSPSPPPLRPSLNRSRSRHRGPPLTFNSTFITLGVSLDGKSFRRWLQGWPPDILKTKAPGARRSPAARHPDRHPCGHIAKLHPRRLRSAYFLRGSGGGSTYTLAEASSLYSGPPSSAT